MYSHVVLQMVYCYVYQVTNIAGEVLHVIWRLLPAKPHNFEVLVKSQKTYLPNGGQYNNQIQRQHISWTNNYSPPYCFILKYAHSASGALTLRKVTDSASVRLHKYDCSLISELCVAKGKFTLVKFYPILIKIKFHQHQN